jgi:uncharacterized protein HemX
MDSHKEKDSDESATPDTSHLATTSKKSKKSNKKLVIILVALVVVVVAALGGGLYYKKVQDDQKAKDAAAATAAATASKPLTSEEKMTATLTDGVKKQISIYEQDDGKAAIENSTTAAQNIGRNLNESDLKE